MKKMATQTFLKNLLVKGECHLSKASRMWWGWTHLHFQRWSQKSHSCEEKEQCNKMVNSIWGGVAQHTNIFQWWKNTHLDKSTSSVYSSQKSRPHKNFNSVRHKAPPNASNIITMMAMRGLWKVLMRMILWRKYLFCEKTFQGSPCNLQ